MKAKQYNRITPTSCIFYPCIKMDNPVNHTQQQQKQTTTKIKKLNPQTKNEIYISDYIIRHIPNYSLYFSPTLSHSVLSLAEVDDDIITVSASLSQYISMTYANTHAIQLSNYRLIKDYLYLLNTIEILQQHGLVHGNIHLENIVYSNSKNYPLLKDFSQTFNFRKINQERKSNLIPPAFELFVVNHLQQTSTSLSHNKIEHIINEYISQFPEKDGLRSRYEQTYKKALVFSLSQHINSPIQKITNELMDNYLHNWQTIDVFDLSMAILVSTHPINPLFFDILFQVINPIRLSIPQIRYKIETMTTL